MMASYNSVCGGQSSTEVRRPLICRRKERKKIVSVSPGPVEPFDPGIKVARRIYIKLVQNQIAESNCGCSLPIFLSFLLSPSFKAVADLGSILHFRLVIQRMCSWDHQRYVKLLLLHTFETSLEEDKLQLR